MTSEALYDDLLFPILNNEGNIVSFFDRIFEFLYRRTDFFKVKGRESSDLGLSLGEAETIVRNVFYKYTEQALSETKSCETEPTLPECFAEETVVTSSEPDSTESTHKPVVGTEESKHQLETRMKGNQKEDRSDVRIPVMDPDCYNGARLDGYSWSQTLKDVDVRLTVPSNISSGKLVRVTIQQSRIKSEVCVDNTWSVLREGELTCRINVEESTWTLVPGEHIHICLQKIQERWWDSCFVGETKIDLKSIDSSIPYEELDRDSQTKIEELMYNEHLKRIGKPTSQQMKYQDILKEAWNKDGSPFRGQPFDPALVNIQNPQC